MNRFDGPCARRHQRGFTLVELMVSLVVGLILLAGLLQILLTSREGYDAQQTTDQLQENLRLAEFVVSYSVAHAGFYTDYSQSPGVIFAASDVSPVMASGAAIGGTSNTTGQSDTLRIRFQGRGGVRDCRGTDIGDNMMPALADFEFYVNDDKTLICHVIGSNRQPIVENVRRFEVSYGLDTTSPVGADRYVSVLSADQASKVRSVRIQLLIASDPTDPALPKRLARTFTFADGSTESVNDRAVYMMMDETIALPNLIP